MGKKQVQKHDSGQIDLDTTKIELEEINYDLDSDTELENNYDLIKYEFNMIELPFFSKDKKIEKGKARKYIFSKKDNSYMQITPTNKPGITSKIPQEFDEKVFFGILKLSREQQSIEVVTDYFTLAKASGVSYHKLGRIKDSVLRLRLCEIEFNNLFYNAAHRKKMDGNHSLNILQDKKEYTLKQTANFPEDQKEHYKKYFRNSKITEILVLTLTKDIYDNIENKGFLYFDQKKLLDISNATARKIYLLITKWKGWENKNYIRRSCRFISSRIPLSWESRNIANTLKTIEKSCEILKNAELIKDYEFNKTKPVGNSYVTFIFNSDHNKIDSYNTKASRTPTGHEELIINNVEDEYLDDRQTTLFDDQGELDLKKKEQELKEKAAQVLESLDEKEKARLINRARNSMQYDHYKYKVEQEIITEEELLNEVILLIIEKDIESGIIQ